MSLVSDARACELGYGLHAATMLPGQETPEVEITLPPFPPDHFLTGLSAWAQEMLADFSIPLC